MENYIKIQPEVICGLGEKTTFKEFEPPFKTILNLHIDLEDWLGDDLMECYPAFIITEKLKKGLEISDFSGFKFSEMEVSKAEYFEDNYQLEKPVPIFFWLQVIGQEFADDILLNDKKELYLKPKLLKYLQGKFNVNYLQVEPQRNEFDDLLDNMLLES
ncbi:hypothetical protein JCM19274_5677 [Algibacter lectus]|uniref:Uncharacterized protein n=1 Tax=Algibacter lectus TaxID=221126 RepID=A0A090X787_9FLAO|nr:hypothetical protein [Algibacter lectus]GAL82602.1 hypothetical protein JCM19274_5677 [Algibacter lectus]